MQVRNYTHLKVAPPKPDVSPRPPPPLRIGLLDLSFFSRTRRSRKTLADNILQSRVD